MASWVHEYGAALDARDATEQANHELLRAYAKLADRVGELETSVATATPPPPTVDNPPLPSTMKSPWNIGSPKGTLPAPSLADGDAVNRLRSDLQATQRARQTLQSQLSSASSTVSSLRSQSEARDTQIAQLTRTKEMLERKLKDRNDEVKGKGRLATEAQDEMVALQLQLNLIEKKNQDLVKENEMLVERWMKEMGKRAEKMNLDSKWH